MTDGTLAIVIGVLFLWAGLLGAYARPLLARWREPVLRRPMLVLESDDWGAGPLEQTAALSGVLDVLRRFRDETARAPVMTLGMIFEIPDTGRIAAGQMAHYYARRLDDACFLQLRGVIEQGVGEGIFVPQLHGEAHYWPAAVMHAALDDAQVRAWLTRPGFPRSEQLPSPLQSRWVDASRLPSSVLASQDVERAVAAEAQAFRAHFGDGPRVAVATTFVWDDVVEQAWHRIGVEVVVAPGKRYTLRDAEGRLGGVDREILTGERSGAGQCYIVRDAYFEPALGHPPERLVAALRSRTRQGRACLVEMHRFNFLDRSEPSRLALRDAMRGAFIALPHLRFIAPHELAQAIRTRDASVLEITIRGRLRAWLARIEEIPRFRRLAMASGLMLPLLLAARVL